MLYLHKLMFDRDKKLYSDDHPVEDMDDIITNIVEEWDHIPQKTLFGVFDTKQNAWLATIFRGFEDEMILTFTNEGLLPYVEVFRITTDPNGRFVFTRSATSCRFPEKPVSGV